MLEATAAPIGVTKTDNGKILNLSTGLIRVLDLSEIGLNCLLECLFNCLPTLGRRTDSVIDCLVGL